MPPDGPRATLHYEPPLPLSRPPAARPPASRAVAVCSIIGLCMLFGYYVAYDNLRLSHGHYGDFPPSSRAARAALDEKDMYKAYEAALSYVSPPLYAVCCT